MTLGGGTTTLSSGGTFELSGTSVLSGGGTFAGNGSFNWTGGQILANLNLGAGIALNLTGAADKDFASCTITSGGTATLNGTGNFNGGSAGVFNNTGTFTVVSDAALANYTGGTAVFVNNGTFIKSGGTNTVFSASNNGITFTNQGVVNVQIGALTFQTPYAPSATSQFGVSLGGVNPATQYGYGDLALPVTLAGTLNVSLKNGFIPTNGQSFAIVRYTSNAGQFSAKNLPTLPDGLNWQVAYGDTALTLTVVRQIVVTNPVKLANGHFQFTLSGPNASSALILGSTNLMTWFPLLTNTPFNGNLLFDDPLAASSNARFYQIQITP